MIDLNSSDYIYKYFPYNLHSIELLINHRFWLGSPNKLNDPFEGEFIIKNIQDLHNKCFIEELLIKNRNNLIDEFLFENYRDEALSDINKFQKILYEYVNSQIMSKYGITSFSRVSDNIKMWSHYADSHKGFCLIFNKNTLSECIQTEAALALQTVNYNEEIPEIVIEYESKKINIKIDENIFLQKQSSWHEESEIRIIKNIDLGFFTQRFLKFAEYCIAGIIYGARCDIETVRTLNKIFENYTNKNIFTIAKKTNSNSLEINEVKNLIW